MTHTGYEKAVNAYQDVQDKNVSSLEIGVRLHKGIIKNLYQAKDAYGEGRFEDTVDLNTKTNKILMALQSHLSPDMDDEASNWLNDFYNHVFLRTSAIFRHDDPVQEYADLIELVKPVHDKWAACIKTH